MKGECLTPLSFLYYTYPHLYYMLFWFKCKPLFFIKAVFDIGIVTDGNIVVVITYLYVSSVKNICFIVG